MDLEPTNLETFLKNAFDEKLEKDTAEIIQGSELYANGGESDKFNNQLFNLPVFPEWFFTARIGQPRKINYLEIRNFAQSPWIQMVLNTIKKEVSTVPWDIVNVEEDDREEYSEKKKLAMSFFKKIDNERNNILDLCNESITDIGEIDAMSWVKVYSVDSYEWKELEILDDAGNVVGTEVRPMLKPFGERELLMLRNADPATILKQIDIYKNLKAYYQYSWKNPRSSPIRFEPDEIAYNLMNKRSHKLYGFSPVQSIQQVLELLMQSTRYNKDFFKNNAFPDGLISLPQANQESLKMFKKMWLEQVKGKPHKLIWHNTDAKFHAFNQNNKDMQWLEGQKWYYHLVLAVFGVSPAEVGFHEDVNRSTQEGQERVTVRNAIKPFLRLFEDTINKFILPELFQEDDLPFCFKFMPVDHQQEMVQFQQAMQEIKAGTLTVEEYRTMMGRDALPEPSVADQEPDIQLDEEKGLMIPYKKAFEAHLKNG